MMQTRLSHSRAIREVSMKDKSMIVVVAALSVWGAAAGEKDLDWSKAQFLSVAAPRDKAKGEPNVSTFRSVFKNPKAVKSAVWHTTGLGVYEAYVNGTEVGGFLKPGYTHPKRCRLATASDVTASFKREAGAENVLAASVSASWWRDMVSGYPGREAAFAGILRVTYSDGTTADYPTTVSGWQGAYAGPLRSATIFNGEVYDAREPQPWTVPAIYGPVKLNTEFAGEVRPMAGGAVHLRTDLTLEPVAAWTWKGIDGATEEAYGTVRKVRTFKPGEAMTVAAGETLVVDFGQNCAAVPEFAFAAEKGVKANIRFGEMLNAGNGEKKKAYDGPAGSVYLINLRDAKARVDYTFGGGEATYRPGFSYFGYRYLTLTATGDVTVKSVKSVPVTSIAKEQERNTIVTSDPLLNKLVSCVMWSARSNYLSIPTDCPQRNERQGWMGDAQVFVPAALYAAETSGFLTKFMDDIRDTQCEDGAFSCVAPTGCYGNTERGSTGWADAGIFIPYRVWLYTGDDTIVRRNWSAMLRYMDWLDLHDGPDPRYGDWLSFERATLVVDDEDYRRILDMAYWIWDARNMATLAEAIGDKDSLKRFTDLDVRLTKRFRETFLAEDGTVKPFWASQVADLFVLKLKLAPSPSAMNRVREHLVGDIRAHGNHLQTGFLGTSILMDTLSEQRETRLAYTLLLNRDVPSWLHNVCEGATTIWERWNSYTEKEGFAVDGGVGCMNSFNHYAYGSVLAWMYGRMAGIRPDPKAPGFKHFFLTPQTDPRVKSVKASYNCPYGTIESEWKINEQGEDSYRFVIPEGTTATVVVPNGRNFELGPGTYLMPDEE